MAIDPTLNITNAIQAYDNASRTGGVANALPVQDSGVVPTQGGFQQLLANNLDQAVQIGQQAEVMSIAGVQNTANLSDVVLAVSEAEVTLQTVVAIRDKVVDAYKEILRMPI